MHDTPETSTIDIISMQAVPHYTESDSVDIV
jgi:hypothetical protein